MRKTDSKRKHNKLHHRKSQWSSKYLPNKIINLMYLRKCPYQENRDIFVTLVTLVLFQIHPYFSIYRSFAVPGRLELDTLVVHMNSLSYAQSQCLMVGWHLVYSANGGYLCFTYFRKKTFNAWWNSYTDMIGDACNIHFWLLIVIKWNYWTIFSLGRSSEHAEFDVENMVRLHLKGIHQDLSF